MTSQFMAYDESYTGGVSLSTGWVAGAEGGAKSIVTGQLAGDGTVRVWSTGSRLDGQPEHVPGQPEPSRGERQVRPDRVVRTVRRRHAGRDGGDHQHDLRGRSSGGGMAPGGHEVRKFDLRAPDAGRDDVGAEAGCHASA